MTHQFGNGLLSVLSQTRPSEDKLQAQDWADRVAENVWYSADEFPSNIRELTDLLATAARVGYAHRDGLDQTVTVGL